MRGAGKALARTRNALVGLGILLGALMSVEARAGGLDYTLCESFLREGAGLRTASPSDRTELPFRLSPEGGVDFDRGTSFRTHRLPRGASFVEVTAPGDALEIRDRQTGRIRRYPTTLVYRFYQDASDRPKVTSIHRTRRVGQVLGEPAFAESASADYEILSGIQGEGAGTEVDFVFVNGNRCVPSKRFGYFLLGRYGAQVKEDQVAHYSGRIEFDAGRCLKIRAALQLDPHLKKCAQFTYDAASSYKHVAGIPHEHGFKCAAWSGEPLPKDELEELYAECDSASTARRIAAVDIPWGADGRLRPFGKLGEMLELEPQCRTAAAGEALALLEESRARAPGVRVIPSRAPSQTPAAVAAR